MPKPDCDQILDEVNEVLMPYHFDILKFYASIISYNEEDQSELLGLEGAQTRIFELIKRIR